MVETSFSDADIAKLAINMEARGMAFYKSAARLSDNPEVVRIFHKLAEEEKEHREIFTKLFTNLTGENKLFTRETAAYLKAVLSSSLFPEHDQADKVLEGVKTVQEALAVGIQAEKDAILLYHELYQNAENDETREVLSKLLEEEKMHLVDLRDYLEDLRA